MPRECGRGGDPAVPPHLHRRRTGDLSSPDDVGAAGEAYLATAVPPRSSGGSSLGSGSAFSAPADLCGPGGPSYSSPSKPLPLRIPCVSQCTSSPSPAMGVELRTRRRRRSRRRPSMVMIPGRWAIDLWLWRQDPGASRPRRRHAGRREDLLWLQVTSPTHAHTYTALFPQVRRGVWNPVGTTGSPTSADVGCESENRRLSPFPLPLRVGCEQARDAGPRRLSRRVLSLEC